MSRFSAANGEYNLVTENDISIILSHFSGDYIFDIINENIKNRFKFMQLDPPNIVVSLENYFKQLLVQYPCNEGEIRSFRQDTYINVIDLICKEYSLQFVDNGSIQDYYSIAFYLYDLLVSNFTNNMTIFFTNYIVKEKNSIYEAMNLNKFKKNKDVSTISNKKKCKNTKLAIIVANLEYVLRNMCAYDIPFDLILNMICKDKTMVKFLTEKLVPVQDFFRLAYAPITASSLLPIMLTNIKIEIQKYQTDDINNINGGF